MNLFTRSCLLVLASVVFVTTTCFAVDVHYCENEIQSVAVFQKATPCGNMVKVEPKMRKCCLARKAKLEKELQGKTVFKKKSCCSNKSVGFKTDTEQHSSTIDISSISVAILGEFTSLEVPVLAFSLASNCSHRAPPDWRIPLDFQILYQVFQI